MRCLRRGAVVVLGLCLLLSTAARVQTWGSPWHLWATAVAHSPEKPRPRINLAREYEARGAEGLAAYEYRQAISLSHHAARMRVEGPMRSGDVARLNLARLSAAAGRYDEALTLLAAIQPRPARSWVTFLERQWRHERAHGGPSQGF